MNAAEVIRIKELLPTDLGSEELRERFAGEILRRSLFSAKMTSARYLAVLRDLLGQFVKGEINQADIREKLMSVLEMMGHSPQDEGGLANPASIRRLNLIVETQREMASSVALLSEQTEATVEMYPAWRLTRLETRMKPRLDWYQRWASAYQAVAGEGALDSEFVALKSSPIWQALGDGAGGFRDTLGNPYPPFAYSSGMDWMQVDRDTCVRLGLIEADEKVAAPGKATLTPSEQEIADAAKRYGFNFEDYA